MRAGLKNFVLPIALLIGQQAAAETPAALDSLSRATATEEEGLMLARKQAAEGDLVSALASTERVLINHPQDAEALLLHASLLCRLGDPKGYRVEVDALRGAGVPDDAFAEIMAPCNARRNAAQAGG